MVNTMETIRLGKWHKKTRTEYYRGHIRRYGGKEKTILLYRDLKIKDKIYIIETVEMLKRVKHRSKYNRKVYKWDKWKLASDYSQEHKMVVFLKDKRIWMERSHFENIWTITDGAYLHDDNAQTGNFDIAVFYLNKLLGPYGYNFEYESNEGATKEAEVLMTVLPTYQPNGTLRNKNLPYTVYHIPKRLL